MEPRISLITLGVQNLERSYRFYKEGLGFPTSMRPEEKGVVFFRNGGSTLAIYPYADLAKDVGEEFNHPRSKFTGITLAHNTRTKAEVDDVLAKAVAAGAKLEKPAHDTFWGGYSGYFSDPDGYLWEVAYGAFEIRSDGSLVVP